MKSFVTHSAEETIELGRSLARELPSRAVVLLIGNLGAGKTTLAKGIVSGLGAAEPDDVVSPTFTLIHEYGRGDSGGGEYGGGGSGGGEPGDVHVFHIDLYRLDTPGQVATLGLEEIFERDAVVLIEWGERFPQLMPPEAIRIELRASGDDRVIEVR